MGPNKQPLASTVQILTSLFKMTPSAIHKKGRLLIYAGDQVTNFYFIKNGYVRVYTITDDGEERTLLILGPNDIFPLLKNPALPDSQSLYFYEAMEDIKLSVIAQDQLLTRIRVDSKTSWAMFLYISEFNSVLANRLAIMESKNAEDKVIQVLNYLVTVCGELIGPNKYLLKLKLTHQEIANLMGYTRESASIAIKKLEDQGAISYQDGYLVINKA